MSFMTLIETMKRIEHTDPSSPIAVFAAEEGMFEVVCANTIMSRSRSKNDARYIGTYSFTDDYDYVFHTLKSAIKKRKKYVEN